MSLPQELQMKPMSKPHQATVYTYKTQPVSFTQDMVKFHIPASGIMSSGGAYIEFSFQPKAGYVAFPPVSIGIHSLINRVRLLTQTGRVILDQRYWNKKQVIEKASRTSEKNHFVHRYFEGSGFAFKVVDHQALTDTSTLSALNTLRLCGDPTSTLNYESKKVNLLMSDTKSQQFRVTLAELFPFLYEHQLPVGIMENLYIELFFERDTQRGKVVCAKQTDTYQSGGVVESTSCFLMTDHLIYDVPEVMANIEAIQEQKGGIAFPYQDYSVQIQTSPQDAAAADYLVQEYNRDMGCDNYKLCDIKNIELDNLTTDPNNIFGYYYSKTRCGSFKSLNYTINDVNLYPNNDAEPPETYYRLKEVYGSDPCIPRPLYMVGFKKDAEPLNSNITFNGHPITELGNRMNIHGVYLKDIVNKELQNGNQPIRVYYKSTTTTDKQTADSTDKFDKSFTNIFFVTYKREFAVAKSGNVLINEFS